MPEDQIARLLGEIKASVQFLVDGQKKLFDLTDVLQASTAVNEFQSKDIERRLNDVEKKQDLHSDELAEGRGASRTNRWLSIVIPPVILAGWETVRMIIASGHR